MLLEHESVRDLLAKVTQREVPTLLERAGGLDRLAHAEAFEIAAHLDERDPDTRARGAPIESPSRATLDAARALAAAFELGRRVETGRRSQLSLADSDAIERWAAPRLATLPFEEVWVLAVDDSLYLRAARCIARGGPHSTPLRIADPVRAAMRLDASAFFMVHNHPTGDPTPSREDIELTQHIAAASMIVDIPLLEHVIVARRGFARIPIKIRDVDDSDR
jgi:DNA repair protein RadC